MNVLFSNSRSEAARFAYYNQVTHSSNPGDSPPPPPSPCPKSKGMKWGVFLEQLINSAIVGGIAGLAALSAGGVDAGWKTALIAFGMTVLVELRKYRNL